MTIGGNSDCLYLHPMTVFTRNCCPALTKMCSALIGKMPELIIPLLAFRMDSMMKSIVKSRLETLRCLRIRIGRFLGNKGFFESNGKAR